MQKNELISHADKIPSLGNGGKVIRDYLIKYAQAVKPNRSIVEVGSWLGSATGFLCAGSILGHGNLIHAYDLWKASPVYVKRAERFHDIKFAVNQDLLPVFLKNTKQFSKYIVPHKGSIVDACYQGEDIGLAVFDMGQGKLHTDAALRVFEDSFIPGETIIFFMDYYFYETHCDDRIYRYQLDFANLNEKIGTLEFIERPKKSRTAIFRYLGQLDYSVKGESCERAQNE